MFQKRKVAAYTLFNIGETETGGDGRVEVDRGRRRQDIGAVDHVRGVVTESGENTDDELEVTLHLHLIVCSCVGQKSQ